MTSANSTEIKDTKTTMQFSQTIVKTPQSLLIESFLDVSTERLEKYIQNNSNAGIVEMSKKLLAAKNMTSQFIKLSLARFG